MTETVYSDFTIIIRIPKAEAAFTYFQLEANENICFYSTLEESLGQGHRDIKIQGSRHFHEEVLRLLNVLAESFVIEYIQK